MYVVSLRMRHIVGLISLSAAENEYSRNIATPSRVIWIVDPTAVNCSWESPKCHKLTIFWKACQVSSQKFILSSRYEYRGMQKHRRATTYSRITERLQIMNSTIYHYVNRYELDNGCYLPDWYYIFTTLRSCARIAP